MISFLSDPIAALYLSDLGLIVGPVCAVSIIWFFLSAIKVSGLMSKEGLSTKLSGATSNELLVTSNSSLLVLDELSGAQADRESTSNTNINLL